MKNHFITHSGQIIDLFQADRVFAGKLVDIDAPLTSQEWAVLVEIDKVQHVLAATGNDEYAARFHADAIGISLGLVKGGEC